MTAYRAETIGGMSLALQNAAKLMSQILSCGRVAVIEVKEGKRKRTVEQNSKMWPMLGDISRQVMWHGQRLSSEDWKDIFTASLKGQRSAPGLDGRLVIFGSRTSEMNTEQMADMIELMYSFGAEYAVEWSEPEEVTA